MTKNKYTFVSFLNPADTSFSVANKSCSKSCFVVINCFKVSYETNSNNNINSGKAGTMYVTASKALTSGTEVHSNIFKYLR